MRIYTRDGIKSPIQNLSGVNCVRGGVSVTEGQGVERLAGGWGSGGPIQL